MAITIINDALVRELMTMEECIDLMREALKNLSRGSASMLLRTAMWLPDKKGLLGMMPAFDIGAKVMGLKVVSVFPGNFDTIYDSHQGGVMLFETDNGRPLALIDGSSITAIRTAAVSAVATDLLARRDAGDLAILGSGTQARMHLEALMQVRDIRRIRVWSQPLDHARQFAAATQDKHGLTVEVMETAQATVAGADIICTLTPAPEPILFGQWVREGAHINAVGSCTPTAREIDTDTVVRSRLYVDHRASTLHEAGDFLIPRKEGAVSDTHIIGEIGGLLLGEIEGRQSETEITLFESLGLPVEDLAAARFIYKRALEKGLGTTVDW
ncbi:MAG: ornithine cyclodeaminase family protein [bacterium]